MKKLSYQFILLIILAAHFHESLAQYDCSSAERLKITGNQTPLSYTLALPGTVAQSGPDYGCMTNLTRPIWGYFAICENNLSILDLKFTFNSVPSFYKDTLNFIVWEALNDQSACSQLTSANIVYCTDLLIFNSIVFPHVTVYLTALPPGKFYYFMLSVKDSSLLTNVDMVVSGYQAGTNTWPFDSCNVCNNEVSYVEDEKLCVVTVDSATNKNKLVWEKNNDKGIARYDLYKEGFVAGVFDSIASQPFTDFTEFIDVNSNPAQQSYKYNIKAADSCNYKLTNNYGYYFYHTTIHLISYPGGINQASLIWNNYGGATTTGTTYIYRNNVLIDSVPSSNTNYTDMNAPGGSNTYQVEQRLSTTCNPSRITSTGYLTTRSNLSQVVVTGMSEIGNESNMFAIFPNPATSSIQLTINTKTNAPLECEIWNMMGERMFEKKLEIGNLKSETTLDISFLSKGIYVVRVNEVSRKLVVE